MSSMESLRLRKHTESKDHPLSYSQTENEEKIHARPHLSTSISTFFLGDGDDWMTPLVLTLLSFATRLYAIALNSSVVWYVFRQG
jgi:hypothetical protein